MSYPRYLAASGCLRMGVEMKTLFVGVISIAVGSAASAEPFDFKGIPLGITIDQFKAMPHPDGKNAAVRCGPEYEFRTITCEFKGEEFGSNALKMGGGRYVSYVNGFEFAPDASGTLRLYNTHAETNIAAVPDVLAALTQKFGVPKTTRGTVRNGVGNSFPSVTHVWSRPDSEIRLEAPFSKTTDMNLSFTYKPIAARLKAMEAAKQAGTPNKI